MKDFFTPRGLLLRAAIFALIFAALHVAGLRSYTSILCSTMPDGGAMQKVDAFFAMAYIVTYLIAVVIAPVFALAAAMLWAWNRRDPATVISSSRPSQPG